MIFVVGYVIVGFVVFSIAYVVYRVNDELSDIERDEDLNAALFCGASWPFTIVYGIIVAFKYGLDRLAEYIYHKSKKKKETKD